MQNLVETVEVCLITKHDVRLQKVLIVRVNASTNATICTPPASHFIPQHYTVYSSCYWHHKLTKNEDITASH